MADSSSDDESCLEYQIADMDEKIDDCKKGMKHSHAKREYRAASYYQDEIQKLEEKKLEALIEKREIEMEMCADSKLYTYASKLQDEIKNLKDKQNKLQRADTKKKREEVAALDTFIGDLSRQKNQGAAAQHYKIARAMQRVIKDLKDEKKEIECSIHDEFEALDEETREELIQMNSEGGNLHLQACQYCGWRTIYKDDGNPKCQMCSWKMSQMEYRLKNPSKKRKVSKSN